MEVILGIVVFVALASVIVGVAWLSSQLNIRVGDYKLHIVFNDIGNLHAGDHVNVKGIQVGKVLRTELYEGRPAAYAAIWGVPEGISKDSRFWLKSESLLGGYMVDIDLGSSPEKFETESYVSGSISVGFESLAPDAKRLSERLIDPKTGMLSDMNLSRIASTLASLDSATASLHQVLADTRKPLNTLLDSLGGAATEVKGAVAETKGMIGENRPDIKQVLHRLAQTSSRLDSLTANLGAASGSLRTASDNLRDITQKIKQGDGTMGKLLNDEQLYRDMRKTLSQVDSILVDVQRNPRRYIHISIF